MVCDTRRRHNPTLATEDCISPSSMAMANRR